MPISLTDSSSFDDVVAPIGTDIRNAASVRSAMQPVANRTRFLYDRSTPLADLTALKAVAGPADGLVRFVKGYGPYVFDQASALAESLPSIVAPAAGAGRWLAPVVAGEIEGASGFLKFQTAHTRTVGVPLVPLGISSASGTAAPIAVGAEGFANAFLFDKNEHLFQYVDSLLFNVVNTASTARWGALVDLTRYMHDGAELTSATLNMKGAAAHTQLPETKPSFGVFRRSIVDGTNVALSSSGAVAFDDSSSVAAYQANHSFDYDVDTDNVIDRSRYAYFAFLFDEGGTHAIAGSLYYGLQLSFAGIADMRFP